MTHIRKIVLLAVSVAALVAFAAPAAAQAEGPFWYVNEEKVGELPETEPIPAITKGELRFHLGLYDFYCYMPSGEGNIINSKVQGRGKVPFSNEPWWSQCGAQYNGYTIPGCIGSWEFGANEEGPEGPGITLSSPRTVQFANVYVGLYYGGCEPYFSPQTLYFGGNLTGEWHNPGEANAGCITYSNAGSLKWGAYSVSTTGSLCVSPEEGGTISVK